MTKEFNGEPLTATIFMNPGTSLMQLDANGQLKREFKHLQALCDLGLRINLLSYAGRSEQEFAPPSPNVRLLCNSFGLPHRTYLRRLHQVHALPLLRSRVIRTINVHGMRPALRAHWAWGMPIICRSGFFWSTSIETSPEIRPSQVREAYAYERHIYTNATHIVVVSEYQVQEVLRRAPAAAGKITVIPNYVDCELFQPMDSEKQYDLIYVGYLLRIKNLEAMLEAVERTGASIAIIGGTIVDGNVNPVEPEVEARLKARFGDSNGRIHWLGVMPNEDLPAYINQAKALILCSHSEGAPRCIQEALACGIPVIGSKIGGIQGILRHGETGYLCNTDADSIAAAIEAVLAQPRLIEKMGVNARRFAVENFALQAVARREYDMLVDVARRNPVESALKRVARYIALPR
ncbi:MAG: glycosyltransferase family 4 protein [Chloroflexi bacterium]|nr:glycosyltransferase family 4 protein [Chloroflexota bacterium]